MGKLDRIILCLALCTILGAYYKVVAQSAGGIVTQRGSQIGLVTFGPDVETGVLGEGNFVDGYVKKASSKSFVFPVGGNGAFRPFAAAAEGTLGAYFPINPGAAATGDLFEEGPFNPSVKDISANTVSNSEYWDINGSETTRITLTWNADSKIGTLLAGKDLSKLTIVGWDGNKWTAIKSGVDRESVLGGASSVTAGSVTTTAELVPDRYNIYTLGTISEGALPVVLASFNVRAIEQVAQVQWETISETNSSHFDIERSADGLSWQQIGRVEPLADSSSDGQQRKVYSFVDPHPLPGKSLYRLKMVDLDSSFAYSQLREIAFADQLAAFIYPNPAAEKIYYRNTAGDRIREAGLFDLTGKPVRTLSGKNESMEVGDLPKGMYVLKLDYGSGVVKSYKIFVKQ